MVAVVGLAVGSYGTPAVKAALVLGIAVDGSLGVAAAAADTGNLGLTLGGRKAVYHALVKGAVAAAVAMGNQAVLGVGAVVAVAAVVAVDV